MSSSPPIVRLRLFGSPTLTYADGEPLSGRPVQRHRLALLAILARSPTGIGREVLMAYLWPESDLDQARNLLKVSVYVLRQALGEEAIVSGNDGLRLSASALDVDVLEFESALKRGEHEAAASLYGGPFLEGFSLKESPEFGHWLDRERARLGDAYASALEVLAEGAERRGDVRAAVDWWKTRAAHDPYDSRVAVGLMRALDASGNRAGALRHADIHARLVRDDLGIEPSAEVRGWAERPEPSAWAVEASDALPGESVPVPESSAPPVMSPPPDVPAAPEIRDRRPLIGWAIAGALALTIGVVIARPWAGAGTGASDPAAMAEDIARAVVREMGGRPEASLPARSVRPPTVSVAAWDLYERASRPDVLRTDSAARQALVFFRQAVELDPGFAGAHAGLARLHMRVSPPEDPDMPRVHRVDLASRHAATAVDLDDSLPDAHATLGIAKMSLQRFDSAEVSLLRAVELDPTNSRSREWLAQLYVWTGRFDQALRQAERAVQNDPLSPSARGELARALMVNGRCGEALEGLASLEDLQPPLLRAASIGAQCHTRRGAPDAALAYVTRGLRSAGPTGSPAVAHFLARAGRQDEARGMLAGLVDYASSSGEDAFSVALVYAGLGEIDESLAWLGRAIDDHSITYEIREPWFAELHADPRYALLLERIGLRP